MSALAPLKKRALEMCLARKCYEWGERPHHFCEKHWHTLPVDLQRELWRKERNLSVEAQPPRWKRAVIAAIELLFAYEAGD